MNSNEVFQEIVLKIELIIQNRGDGSEIIKDNPILGELYLANYFNYNVTKGGFAQLIYNLQGNYLEKIENMLLKMNAEIALSFYRKALKICLANTDEYRKFISSHYLGENEVKTELQLLSIEYFAENIEFEDEISEYINQNHSQIKKEIEKLSNDS